MIPFRRIVIPVSLFGALLLCGCNAEVSELKEKLVTMEKRLAKQDKMLVDVEKKFSVPKDFSVDVQRLEDEQEKVRDLIKNKVEPVHHNLGELREWAREVEQERTKAVEKIKQLDQFQNQAIAAIEGTKRDIERLGKELAENSQKSQKAAKVLLEQEKVIAQLGKSLKQLESALQSNSTQILAAVKKTLEKNLPKVKDLAVAEVKGDIEQLEKRMQQRHAGSDPKTPPEGLHIPATPVIGKDEIRELRQKVRELEEIVAKQQAELLGQGAQVHELRMRLPRRQAGATGESAVTREPLVRNERYRRER